MPYDRLSPEQLPGMPTSTSQPFSAAFSAGTSNYTPPPAGSSPVDTGGSNPFSGLGGMGYADAPGIFGIIARLSGAPTRAEAYSERAGGLEQASFKELSNLMDQGLTPQKAMVQFINSPMGHDLFVHDHDALGQVMNYLKTYAGPVQNPTQEEAATDRLVKAGLITGEFRDKMLAGAIKQEAILDQFGQPTGAYNYHDLTTGKTVQYGADSPVNKILTNEMPPEQTASGGQSDPWAGMRQPTAAPGTTPTPTSDVGSAAPTTQNAQQPTDIASDKELAGTRPGTIITSLRDPNGNPDPADVVRAAGVVPFIKRFVGGLVGQQIPGLTARQARAYADSLNMIRMDAQSLRGVFSQNGRNSKADVDTIDRFTDKLGGVWQSPIDLAQGLIDWNRWLDTREQEAKEDILDPGASRKRKEGADAELAAIKRSKSNLPDVEQLEAKIDQINNEPGTVSTGIHTGLNALREIFTKGKEAAEDVKTQAPLTFKDANAAKAAYDRGDLSDCDMVTIGAKTYQINAGNCKGK